MGFNVFLIIIMLLKGRFQAYIKIIMSPGQAAPRFPIRGVFTLPISQATLTSFIAKDQTFISNSLNVIFSSWSVRCLRVLIADLFLFSTFFVSLLGKSCLLRLNVRNITYSHLYPCYDHWQSWLLLRHAGVTGSGESLVVAVPHH